MIEDRLRDARAGSVHDPYSWNRKSAIGVGESVLTLVGCEWALAELKKSNTTVF